MSAATKKAVVETVKSFLRYMWFGALALAITFAEATLTDGTVSGTTAVVLTLVIKLVDTYVHNNKKMDVNGLAPSILQK